MSAKTLPTTQKFGRDLQVGDIIIDPVVGYHPMVAKLVLKTEGIVERSFSRCTPFECMRTTIFQYRKESGYDFTADQKYTVLA